MSTIKKGIIAVGAALVLTATAAIAAPKTSNKPEPSSQQVVKEVHKELATLPYYGIFDNLSYKVEGDTVTLYGQVVKPITRSDAENRVAHINGVAHVVNNIEVLPLSSFDDAIRVRTYQTLFRHTSLSRYALGSDQAIHIIVKNGHLTLEGVVANEADSQLAYMTAQTVPGVFSVTNHLQTERGAKGAR
jgi:hyperosmotically inducible protein